jgi:hypothetical protein
MGKFLMGHRVLSFTAMRARGACRAGSHVIQHGDLRDDHAGSESTKCERIARFAGIFHSHRFIAIPRKKATLKI